MRPRIRYCATPAGRVAYSTTGSGLAAQHTVIRYDKPGCGLSDRDGPDPSFEGQVAAAVAVADAVGAITNS